MTEKTFKRLIVVWAMLVLTWIVLFGIWMYKNTASADEDSTPWLALATVVSVVNDAATESEVSDTSYGLVGVTVLSAFEVSKSPEFWMISASTLSLLADWATTLDMTDRYDEGYYETNPKLGPYPSRGRVNEHFGTLTALHLVGNYLIQQIPSKRWREFLMVAENTSVTLIHGPAAYNNWRIGLDIKF